MRIPGTNAHLTYCLNVHAAETLEDVEENVFVRAVSVFDNLHRKGLKERASGLGLWIPASAAEKLEHGTTLEKFKDRLEHYRLYTFTLNGFPYGRFHGGRVKETVYSPDWSTPERYHYTLTLARILAGLLPEGVEGCISTVPITYKAWASPQIVDNAVTRLMDAASAIEKIGLKSGRNIALALEPEPGCLLESVDDVVKFFSKVIRDRAGYLEKHHGYSSSEAHEIIERRIGICLDAVHSAVMFEDPTETLRILSLNNIRVFKVHLGAAISVKVGKEGPPVILKEFNDNVYLHQVTVQRESGVRVLFSDLPEALESSTTGEWRVHFHVPLSGSLKGTIQTTAHLVSRDFIQAALDTDVRYFEVETYTLTVLPGYKGTVEDVIASELAWVIERFPQMRVIGVTRDELSSAALRNWNVGIME